MPPSIRLATGIFVLALAAQAASADEAPKPRDACRQDAQTLCAGVSPGQGRIIACLAGHRDQVQPACRTALDALRERRPQSQSDSEKDRH